MFERFTDHARRAVVLAQDEARQLNHNYIGTEHILLGLLRDDEGVAAEALHSFGVSLEAVEAQVEEIVGETEAPPSGHIPFTPRAKRVLELALREALDLQDRHIGTEHILLGIAKEGEGVAAQALVALGVDPAMVHSQVRGLLGAAHPAAAEQSRGERVRAVLGARGHVTSQPVGALGPAGEMSQRLGSIEDALRRIDERLGEIERRLPPGDAPS